MKRYQIDRSDWDKALEHIIAGSDVYAAVNHNSGHDYELLTIEHISRIVYNRPKPSTPLKYFFLPVKENTSIPFPHGKPRVIIGAPNCDLEGLKILDEIFLDDEYTDRLYQWKRENTLLVSMDCFDAEEHCHCTAYGVKPHATGAGDISLASLDNHIILSCFSDRGKSFIGELDYLLKPVEADETVIRELHEKHEEVFQKVSKACASLPGYRETGDLIRNSGEGIWKKYASTCVSCGACAAICPTCSCFTLIDKPGFAKVKQLDTCQYPGFQRVAGGEDPLHHLFARFRNRYLCKYVWKPEKFSAIACTGCGRCIEACIGKINKNELFLELKN